MVSLKRIYSLYRDRNGRVGSQKGHGRMHKRGARACARVCLLCVVSIAPALSNAQLLKPTYPRIGAYEIGGTHETKKPEYRQALAKHDIVIMGFWRNWSGLDTQTNQPLTMRDVLIDIKSRAAQIGNDDILLGKYTIFMESGSDDTAGGSPSEKFQKLSNEVGPGYARNNDWWARNSDGENTSSYYGNWNTNITDFVTPDSNGDTWPEWAATYDHEEFFESVPELDIWFIDNWFYRPRVKADWDGDGRNDDRNADNVKRYYREGMMDGLERARQLAPNLIFMGNVDGEPQISQGMLTEPEYRGQLSALYESAIGKSYSQETWGTWYSMMEQYQTTLQNARDGLLLMTVVGEATDYKQMRYGLASCLMDGGYYYYTTVETEYRSALWFDEYDVNLGRPIDPPQFSAWQNGVYRRRFENGVVLVNPKGNGTQTVQVEPGYTRIDGTQDRSVNNGQPASSVTIPARDGIILLNDGANRAPTPRPKPPQLSGP